MTTVRPAMQTKDPRDVLSHLTEVLGNPNSDAGEDADNLIYAFEDVEKHRGTVAALLKTLLEANG